MTVIKNQLSGILENVKKDVFSNYDYMDILTKLEEVEALTKELTKECKKRIKVELDLTLDELDKMTGDK